jgi:hypothetical protein
MPSSFLGGDYSAALQYLSAVKPADSDDERQRDGAAQRRPKHGLLCCRRGGRWEMTIRRGLGCPIALHSSGSGPRWAPAYEPRTMTWPWANFLNSVFNTLP